MLRYVGARRPPTRSRRRALSSEVPTTPGLWGVVHAPIHPARREAASHRGPPLVLTPVFGAAFPALCPQTSGARRSSRGRARLPATTYDPNSPVRGRRRMGVHAWRYRLGPGLRSARTVGRGVLKSEFRHIGGFSRVYFYETSPRRDVAADEQAWLAERFDEHRRPLRAVAYRRLGSRSEADDAGQQAWLRLGRTDASAVESRGGWRTTVVGRISLNMLRSRKARREQPLDVHLPDPILDRPDGVSPEH